MYKKHKTQYFSNIYKRLSELEEDALVDPMSIEHGRSTFNLKKKHQLPKGNINSLRTINATSVP